jgi:hypothetical protein
VRQLHPGDTALFVNEADDSSQRLNVSVHPDTKVLWADPAFWKDGGCFGKHQPSSAYCPAAQMHEVPVVYVSIGAGVLAHWRNKYAVGKCDAANGEGIEQMSHKVL